MENKLNVEKMWRREFYRLPCRGWSNNIGGFDSLILLPARLNWFQVLIKPFWALAAKHLSFVRQPEPQDINGIHDSGFRMIYAVAVRDSEPICILTGSSDVVHIDGFGGYGKDWLNRYGGVPKDVEPKDWSIDCLAVSGLLRLFSNGRKLEAGDELSSFELFASVRKPVSLRTMISNDDHSS